MNSLIKITLLTVLIFQGYLSFSQNFQISNINGPVANAQPCDSFVVLSIAPLQVDSLSNADYLYAISGTNYSAGPIQVDVVWGDGAITSHTGQMTTAGQMIDCTPELKHQYADFNQYTMVINVQNPNNSSQANFTSIVQLQNCETYLYSFNSINCTSVSASLADNVPYVFIDSLGNEYTEWMLNGSATSSQLPSGIYSVFIAQWWLDMNGLIVGVLTPQTIQMSTGSFYTFQSILNCAPGVDNNCLTGTVFCDQNQNGIFDAGDIGINDAPLILTSGNQGQSTDSDAFGVYSFNYLNAQNGVSIISLDPQWLSQYGFTANNSVVTIQDVNCGLGGQVVNFPISCDSSQMTNECIGGWLFCDENNNGFLDQNEVGFANAPVHITGANSTITVFTNSNGNFFYSGNQLGNGVAVVEVEQLWLTQNGYFSNSNLVFTVQTDCNNTQPVYFPIICDSLQTPCADLWTNVSPWIGYYQNQVNYVKLKWGNNGSAAAQSYTLTLNYPAGVTPVTTSFSNSNYTIAGNSISWTVSTSSSYFDFTDVIYFNVPGGLSNGTAHNYSSTIVTNGNNQDCHLNNNSDTLTMVLGNSYDPNDKMVNKQEIISPDVDDELTYRIRFQNTGTAPAQDIYIMDTLDVNLDWSSFELLDASHYIQVIDLGGGIMKFNFPNIWLVDSTVSYDESQGSLTYRIKENVGNPISSTIKNTAYIYFDWNPAIITNTTYNINSVLSLDEMTTSNVKVYPNPFNNELMFDADKLITDAELTDLNGKTLISNHGASIQSIRTDILSSGVYILRLQIDGHWVVQRVIKS